MLLGSVHAADVSMIHALADVRLFPKAVDPIREPLSPVEFLDRNAPQFRVPSFPHRGHLGSADPPDELNAADRAQSRAHRGRWGRHGDSLVLIAILEDPPGQAGRPRKTVERVAR